MKITCKFPDGLDPMKVPTNLKGLPVMVNEKIIGTVVAYNAKTQEADMLMDNVNHLNLSNVAKYLRAGIFQNSVAAVRGMASTISNDSITAFTSHSVAIIMDPQLVEVINVSK